ncbi:MAG: hypothetical protein ABIK44_06055 [candidate division WOR-3 bacterium]
MVGLLFIFTVVQAMPIGETGQALIVIDGENAAYRLADPLIVAGTDSVFLDGELVDRAEYLLDLDNGRIVFLRLLPKWTVLVVKYRCLRWGELSQQQARHRARPLLPVGADSVRVVAKLETAALGSDAADSSSGLDISGSKTLGVSVGTEGGLGLDQATRLTLNGEVEGIAIEAELSDQSSPIPPEGTTRELEELDKLLISLSARDWQGRFGDVELGANAGNLGGVSRKAVGGTLRAEMGQLAFSGGYARPKGRFCRVAMKGMDGVQGPYLLAPDSRSAQIVPGSEEVYLDGVRLVRGWDADYTIDYSTGELVFTNRHIITHLSRIEAEFQYVVDVYERTLVLGGADFRRGQWQLGVTLFREGDNPNRMIGAELSGAERNYLAGIGKDTSRAWLAGGRYVGQGNGDYVLEGDHFRYVGLGLGDYRVTFTYRAESLGAYVYDDSLLAFRFVGSGRGNYVDSVKVTLPQREELVLVRTGLSLHALSARLDGVFRQRALNLFAPSGIVQKNGAFSLDIGWQDSTLGLNYRHRGQGQEFELPGQSPEIDFAYRWGGIEERLLSASDELLARVRLWDSIQVTGEVGRLKTFVNQTVERFGGGFRAWWFSCQAGRAGPVTRQRVVATPGINWLFPKAEWSMESQKDFRDKTWAIGVETRHQENLSTRTELRIIDREESASGNWIREARQRQIQAGADWRWQALRLEGVLTHQKQMVSNEWSQVLGSLSASATPLAGLRFQADLSQSSRQVQLRDEQFRYVGPGQGNYRRDSVTGGYLYDPDGDYERYLVATGRFTAARELSASGSAEVSVFEPFSFTASFSKLRTAADTGVLSDAGNYDLRWALAPKDYPSFTLGANGQRGLDRTLAATGRGSTRFQEYLEIFTEQLPIADFQLPIVEVRSRIERNDAQRMFNPMLAEFEEHGWRFELEPVLGQSLRLELALGFEHKLVSEPVGYPELGRFALNDWDGSIGKGWPLGKLARIRTTLGLAYRTASVSELPFDIGLSRPLGFTPNAGLEFEQVFSQVLSASARYSFLDRPDRKPDHRLSAELRADF